MFSRIRATKEEASAPLPGDEIIPDANVVMDHAFDLPATPERVWPWVVQLGKNRAGWYLPSGLEHFVPPSKRALRRIDPALQDIVIGHIIDDWGGKNATFEIADFKPNYYIVHKSKRGNTLISWTIVLHETAPGTTRIRFRFRMGAVKHRRLAESAGKFIDALTIAGLRGGLRERMLSDRSRPDS